MFHLRACLGVGLSLGLVLSASVARADDGNTARARALFDEAGELERRGQWAPAQARLRAALRLRETPQLHYALGWALENDDKLLDAKTEYETAARLGRERPGAEEATRLALTRLSELTGKLPIIKIRVIDGRPNDHVLVDGRETRREEDVAATFVDPGTHVVRVERGTGEIVEQMVYVGRASIRQVDIDRSGGVAPSDAAQNRHVPVALSGRSNASPKDEHQGRVLPWVLLSSGVVFVAGSAALLLSANGDANARDEMQARWCTATACRGTTATRAETVEAASYRRAAAESTDTGNTKQAVGIVLGGVGLVSAAVGTYLLARPDRETSRSRGQTRVMASPLAGGGFASAAMSF